MSRHRRQASQVVLPPDLVIGDDPPMRPASDFSPASGTTTGAAQSANPSKARQQDSATHDSSEPRSKPPTGKPAGS